LPRSLPLEMGETRAGRLMRHEFLAGNVFELRAAAKGGRC
jgi:hypothetical protein